MPSCTSSPWRSNLVLRLVNTPGGGGEGCWVACKHRRMRKACILFSTLRTTFDQCPLTELRWGAHDMHNMRSLLSRPLLGVVLLVSPRDREDVTREFGIPQAIQSTTQAGHTYVKKNASCEQMYKNHAITPFEATIPARGAEGSSENLVFDQFNGMWSISAPGDIAAGVGGFEKCRGVKLFQAYHACIKNPCHPTYVHDDTQLASARDKLAQDNCKQHSDPHLHNT